MKNSRVVDEFIELTSISAPTLGERQIADVLKRKLTELGLEVYEDKAGEEIGGSCGNIIGILKGTKGTPLALCAHMDRVPNGDNIKHVIKDGKIMSDKTTILAADDISGVTALLGGLRLLKESKKEHGDVYAVFTVSEERLVRGSMHLDYSLIDAKHSYCLDSPGRIGRIINQAPTKVQFFVDVYGKSAHAGQSPEKGVNALKAAAKIMADMDEGRIDSETTANWSIMKAGNVTNVVCEHAQITGEARSRDTKKLNAYIEYVKKHCNDVISKTDATVEVNIQHCFDGFCIDENDELLTTLCSCLEKIGATPLIEAGGGGMDANRFNKNGIKSVGVATGYFNNHSVNEELYIEDLEKSTLLVYELICAYSEKER
jgi:tripeptide aminopeptidase